MVTVQQFSRSVYSLIKSERDHYTLRPFNQFQPLDSMWWIIPSKDWPAYEKAKFCFYKENKTTDTMLFSGIHIEKGRTASLSSKELMDHRWAWNSLVQSETLAALTSSLVRISGKYTPFIQLDAHITKDDYHSIQFSFQPNGQLIKQPTNRNEELFEAVMEETTLDDLLTRCTLDPTLSYVWIDLYIGVKLDLKDFHRGEKDEHLIYQDVLKDLEQFVLI